MSSTAPRNPIIMVVGRKIDGNSIPMPSFTETFTFEDQIKKRTILVLLK